MRKKYARTVCGLTSCASVDPKQQHQAVRALRCHAEIAPNPERAPPFCEVPQAFDRRDHSKEPKSPKRVRDTGRSTGSIPNSPRNMHGALAEAQVKSREPKSIELAMTMHPWRTVPERHCANNAIVVEDAHCARQGQQPNRVRTP